MADFSIILQDPQTRALVQNGILERAFHDALFPNLLFRSEADPREFPGAIGTEMTFTGAGLMAPDLTPITPGDDVTLGSYSDEQWSVIIQQWGKGIETHMPTSAVAIVDLFLRNSKQLGMQAAQSLNRLARETMYNAALDGQTVATALGSSSVSLPVRRLNGFTKARNPNLANGSQVKYDRVSSANPLAITIGASTSASVIDFVPDNAGDEFGPGTLTLAVAKSWSALDAVKAVDASYIVYSGGGTRTDDVGTTDIFTLTNIRAALARMRSNNVPVMPDGLYHSHLDPISEAQIFEDDEFQRLMTSLPDYYPYADFALGKLLGCVFFRDNETPNFNNVQQGTQAAQLYTPADPFGGVLYSNNNASTGVKLHWPVFIGAEGIMEYFLPEEGLITDAGITGKIAEPKINNNSVEVPSERIKMIFRAPLDRLQQKVSSAWSFIGNWVARTDGATGLPERYKREVVVCHGEP